LGRELGLDVAEETGYANSTETDAAIEGVPAGDLGASIEEI
jgi:hypothetical protein